MITLTNRKVQEDLYEIINLGIEKFYMIGHGDELNLVVENNETTTTSYPYESKEALENDFSQLRTITRRLNV